MASPVPARPQSEFTQRLKHGLLAGSQHQTDGQPPQKHNEKHSDKHSWWQVMCLTGVDYFSTLGYQPGIAALAAGALSPLATLILLLLTLFGALPIYRKVAATSPHGEGSLAMLERLLPWWQGKILILCLLGFVATDFIITITLSAADATAHIVENPLVPAFFHGQIVPITLVLVALLGAVFLKGFREAIGIAVILVVVYLVLNMVIIFFGLQNIATHPETIANWQKALFAQHQNPLMLLGISVLVFPKLALGLSGFETGVAVMPLVAGYSDDTEAEPKGRVVNTYKMLTSAAWIMSFFLLTSSVVTTLLIPTAEFAAATEFAAAGKANGRALAFLAHQFFGDIFGTVYDLSTISILWFAGASAMAGLLNIVPRYLPRYGMAPDWTLAVRPLVLVYTAIAFVVTLIFQANVEAQGGAYATGVLVLMTSAAFAVTLASYKKRAKREIWLFSTITLVFIYTTITNIIERPEGIKIAGTFIASIVVTSLVSRVWRSTELRSDRVEIDELAASFIETTADRTVRIIAHRPNRGDDQEYAQKERDTRQEHHLPVDDLLIFLEIQISDPSEFAGKIDIQGHQVGDYRILRSKGAAVPNTIAAILLEIRNRTHKLPHAYFGWAEGNPIQYLMRFILFGEGDIAIVTREVLRTVEKDPKNRPGIHVGG